jgi:hypothetical protein
VRVETGPDRGSAERDLSDVRQRRLDPLAAEPHLRRVAAELLADRHRDGVHQVSPAGLHDVGELLRLLRQGPLEALERRQQVGADLVECGEVDRRRKHVVRGLAHVHVVVRVRAVAGEVCHHLVRVHVRRRARAGLEDVDRELIVVLARRDRVAGLGDPVCDVALEQAKVRVRPRGGGLDPPEPVDHRQRYALSRDGEVLDRLGGLAAPELLRGLFANGHALTLLRYHGRSVCAGSGGGVVE